MKRMKNILVVLSLLVAVLVFAFANIFAVPLNQFRYGNNYGRLSVNRYASGVTNESYKLAWQLKAMRDSM